MTRTWGGVCLLGALGTGCAPASGIGEAQGARNAEQCTSAKTAAAEARSGETREHDASARLAADLAIAKEAVRREQAARIDAEGRAARLAYAVAVAEYNHVALAVVCDAVRGVKDPKALAKVTAASDRLDSFMKDCRKDEPVDACVERKARASAASAPIE